MTELEKGIADIWMQALGLRPQLTQENAQQLALRRMERT